MAFANSCGSILCIRVQTNKQTNVFVKPRTSPFTGGHSSHALRLGPLGGARRTQMRSSALGVLPQCPRGLMLDCARHTSHCESNFGSFCRGCPTQRSRVPSSVSWVDSSRLRSCSVAASRLGFYLVSPPSSRLGSGSRLVASSRVGLAGGSWWLAVLGTNKQTNKQLNTPRTMAVGSRPYPWASTSIPAPSAA